MNDQPFIICENLVKVYPAACTEVVALRSLDLQVFKGEFVALVGPSGSGKSTLLRVIGGLDAPSAGCVRVAGWDLGAMEDRQRAKYKRKTVGFVWQGPDRNLVPYLSARENVELPMILAGMRGGHQAKRAMELLDVAGLAGQAGFRPDRLSGGQQQRLAVAVGLANNPPLLLCDEPTGQIDSRASLQVLDTLRRVNEALGATIILATRDPLVSGLADRIVAIREGRNSAEIHPRREQKSSDMHEEDLVFRCFELEFDPRV